MTENKRFNVFDVDGTIFLEDHKEGSYHIGEIGNVDVNCLNDIADRLNELSDENEQLKKENYKLHKRLGDFEQFEEHIKERTSKTSVNDIIGLVKTDEPIDIVELEKELQE